MNWLSPYKHPRWIWEKTRIENQDKNEHCSTSCFFGCNWWWNYHWGLVGAITLLTKNFNKAFKKLSNKSKGFEGGHRFTKGKGEIIGINEESPKEKKQGI